MSKRPGGDLSSLLDKKNRMDQRSAADRPSATQERRNPYLTLPVNPDHALFIFLGQVRNTALSRLPMGTSLPVKEVS
jgi:hypothetical protein